MKLIYIAGPFTAPTQWQVAQNVRSAEDSGRLIALCGMFPVIPHVLGVHFGDECSAEFWYDGTLELMRRCDGVFLSPGWAGSKGAAAERRVAIEIGLPVADNTGELAMKLGFIKRTPDPSVVDCPVCRGTGTDPSFRDFSCAACFGTGRASE